jgi:hypothetical protein
MRRAVELSERLGPTRAYLLGEAGLLVSTAIVGYAFGRGGYRVQAFRLITSVTSVLGVMAILRKPSSVRPSPSLIKVVWWLLVSLATVLIPVSALVDDSLGWSRAIVAIGLACLGVLEVPLYCLVCGFVGAGRTFSLSRR